MSEWQKCIRGGNFSRFRFVLSYIPSTSIPVPGRTGTAQWNRIQFLQPREAAQFLLASTRIISPQEKYLRAFSSF